MTDDTSTQASPGDPTAVQRLRGCIQAWIQRLAAALLRAEAHIMENFRMPPGGG
jgi:hypothetical protein